jgi:hypothetical protein
VLLFVLDSGNKILLDLFVLDPGADIVGEDVFGLGGELDAEWVWVWGFGEHLWWVVMRESLRL